MPLNGFHTMGMHGLATGAYLYHSHLGSNFQSETAMAHALSKCTVQDGLSEYVWIYFVVLIIVGAFFAVNLALAVLYLQFTQSQAELEIEREEQAAAISAARRNAVQDSTQLQPSTKRQKSKISGHYRRVKDICFRIQASSYFEVLTLALISVNTVIMASEHHNMQEWHSQVCFWLLNMHRSSSNAFRCVILIMQPILGAQDTCSEFAVRAASASSRAS